MSEAIDGRPVERLVGQQRRVAEVIDAVMRRYPTDSKAYYEEVHQHLAPLARELEDALRATVDVVRQWHGDEVWDIYLRCSPEMKKARDALPDLLLPNAQAQRRGEAASDAAPSSARDSKGE